ncbi:hypothetical protein [Ferrimonas gelatinilytica]|uniref:Aminoglycoside phosphotransferase domain-containing protein n=1 Tax=Ferrimonas gelatinilytica TaxID=1255257 RepID=A0ABP9S076_9GAMM
MKQVIDGIYQTGKMHVSIGPHSVTKTYTGSKAQRNGFPREVRALERLRGVAGFPQLINADSSNFAITMSRLPGAMAKSLNPQQVALVRQRVASMLAQGVARHSLPIRDFVVSTDGEVGMADFERTTLRRCRFSPLWVVATLVTQYNLSRLVRANCPEALGAGERLGLHLADGVRAMLQPLVKSKKALRRARRRRFEVRPSEA